MRLIDADALLKKACWFEWSHEDGDETAFKYVDTDDIEDAPTIDAVPVIRCKDCVKRPTCEHTRALGINGYCSDGERRAAE